MDTAQESARVKTLEDENRKLREQVARASTRDLVAAKTSRMTPAMAEVVRESFKDRIASEKEIDAFVANAKRIAEAHAKDSAGDADRAAELPVGGWVDDTTTNDGPSDGALLREAFHGLRLSKAEG